MYRDEEPYASIVERVAGLVEASGLDPREFARRADLDEEKLIISLAGHRRFSSLDLALIGDSCQVSVEWLITGQRPRWWTRLWVDIVLRAWWRFRLSAPIDAIARSLTRNDTGS